MSDMFALPLLCRECSRPRERDRPLTGNASKAGRKAQDALESGVSIDLRAQGLKPIDWRLWMRSPKRDGGAA